jgi:hypothetical protein
MDTFFYFISVFARMQPRAIFIVACLSLLFGRIAWHSGHDYNPYDILGPVTENFLTMIGQGLTYASGLFLLWGCIKYFFGGLGKESY